MSFAGRILILVLLLAVSGGCVTRTYEGKTGKAGEKRTIWIWEQEYRHP